MAERSGQDTGKSQVLRSDQMTGLDSFFHPHSLVFWTETIQEKPHRWLCPVSLRFPLTIFIMMIWHGFFFVTELPAISCLSSLPTGCLYLLYPSEELEKQFLKPNQGLFPLKPLFHIEIQPFLTRIKVHF